MKQDSDIFLALLTNFALCSLMAVGGANSVVPEMHRQAATWCPPTIPSKA